MKKLNILLISEFFPRSDKVEITGGVETRAYFVARELAKRHNIIIIASHEKGFPKVSFFSGFKVIRAGKELNYTQKGNILGRLFFLIASIKLGIKLAKKIKFNIVDGYNFMSYPQSYFIGKKLKIPKVITYHDVWVGKWIKHVGLSGILMEFLERWILFRKGKKWDKIITNSNYTKKNLMKLKIPKNKIQAIYSGVDLSSYKIKLKKYNRPTICFAGRLVDYKRVNDLIEAVKIVKKTIPTIEVKICGSGPELNNLKRLTKQLNLEDNVEFLGYVNFNILKKIMYKSHLFSLPSEVEGLGLVTIEAMASGLPYVNSKIPPTVEATDNGKGGLLFETNNVEEFAEKIIQLLTNKKLYYECVKKAKIVVKKFDWKTLARKIENIYLNLDENL